MKLRTVAELDEIHDALAAEFAKVEAPIMDLVAALTRDPGACCSAPSSPPAPKTK